jgi:hypothetical protein
MLPCDKGTLETGRSLSAHTHSVLLGRAHPRIPPGAHWAKASGLTAPYVPGVTLPRRRAPVKPILRNTITAPRREHHTGQPRPGCTEPGLSPSEGGKREVPGSARTRVRERRSRSRRQARRVHSLANRSRKHAVCGAGTRPSASVGPARAGGDVSPLRQPVHRRSRHRPWRLGAPLRGRGRRPTNDHRGGAIAAPSPPGRHRGRRQPAFATASRVKREGRGVTPNRPRRASVETAALRRNQHAPAGGTTRGRALPRTNLSSRHAATRGSHRCPFDKRASPMCPRSRPLRTNSERVGQASGSCSRESLSELAKLGARLIIQRALEDEFDAWLGRARYERRPEYQRGLRNYDSGLGNGFRPRTVQTNEGELEVAIPQVREAAETFASKLFIELRDDRLDGRGGVGEARDLAPTRGYSAARAFAPSSRRRACRRHRRPARARVSGEPSRARPGGSARGGWRSGVPPA